MTAEGTLRPAPEALRDLHRAALYGADAREAVYEQDGYRLFFREVGPADGALTLLIHGFPQTGAMWTSFLRAWPQASGGAPRRFLIPDLPGYGRSAAPAGVDAAAKSAWARIFVGLLDALGLEALDVVGHDRGGRLGYRMALEHPGRVARLAVLDILPTIDYWRGVADPNFAVKIYHWMFLAQPAPLPETLIGAAPDYYMREKLRSWTAAGDLSCYGAEAMAEYLENGRQRLGPMCDDYRAGAGPDLEADRVDLAAGRKIVCPLCALWGANGIAGRVADPLAAWSAWATTAATGSSVQSGHFLPEEAPDETAAKLAAFLA